MATFMTSPKLLTVAQAAARLGVSLQAVRKSLQKGWFPGAYNDRPDQPLRGTWRIPVAGLEAYQAAKPWVRPRTERGTFRKRGS